jgi:ribosome-associated protein
VKKDSQEEDKSRSQLKREFREVKELGIQLAGLSEGQLKAIPLSDKTREALMATKGMARNALQRQYRFISSRLEKEDVTAIKAALAGALQPHAEEVANLHEAERWRDRLLSDDGSQIAAFTEQFPQCDRTHLALLVQQAKKERDLDQPPRSARQLFRYIRQSLDRR